MVSAAGGSALLVVWGFVLYNLGVPLNPVVAAPDVAAGGLVQVRSSVARSRVASRRSSAVGVSLFV